MYTNEVVHIDASTEVHILCDKVNPIKNMKISDKCQVTLIDHIGTDISVVNAARVSFDKQSVSSCS